MKGNSFAYKSLHWLFCYLLAISAILSPSQAYAVYDDQRTNSYSWDSGACNTVGNNKYIKYDPFGTNVDYDFEITNTTCIAFAAAVGATMFAADKAATAICQAATYPPNQVAAGAKTSADIANPPVPYPTPGLLVRMAAGVTVCSAMAANTAAAVTECNLASIPPATFTAPALCAMAAASGVDQTRCCAALSLYAVAVGAMLSALAIIHGLSNQAYATGRVCGHDWYGWKEQDSIWTKVMGPHQLCLRNLFLGENNSGVNSHCSQDSSIDITNVSYREFIYGGVEKEDDDTGSCTNPTTWSSQRKLEILGYDSNSQRYYMTGPGSAPVFACYRFLAGAKTENGYTAEQDQTAMQKAYDCCKTRSQNAICIETKGGTKDANGLATSVTDYKHKFCEMGAKCTVNGVVFEAYASTREVNYVCAKTYSVCPYNHLLGGGTEVKKENEGNIENYCQFLKHCSKLPILPYVRTSSLTGGYIDSSCRDMKGDSQNVYGYTAELLPINTKGFTAPMVQCFKETMQNIFLNEAGHTECLNPDEPPDQNDYCSSGYIFKKGTSLEGDSFFVKMQKRFQLLLKMVLTLSVVFYGVMILMAVPNAYIERKTIFPYILKIALVAYFCLGNAWQVVFINDLLGASGTLAAIAFKPDDDSAPTNKLDGCQFPRYNYADSNEATKYNNPAYPPGKDYIEVWDILDCKLARALGFGPEVSVPNLIFMILGGFLTAGLGLVFVIAAFIFAFFLIFMTIRALQFFLVAMTAVIILLYASVFIIPMCLFQRTKNIFDSWWKQILGFTLQPMILFAYLGVLIAIFDNIVIGSATFSPATVKINGVQTVDTYGRVMPKTINCNNSAKNDSIYCIFQVADIETYNGFEALGIGLPMLASMNATKLVTLMKGAFLMFIFSQFMDKISTVASTLVGGATIKADWADNFKPHELASKALGKLDAIQKRGMGAMKKAGGAVARKGVDMATTSMNRFDRGKSTAKAEEKAAPPTDSTGKRDAGQQKEASGDNVASRDKAATDEVQNEPKNPDAVGGDGQVQPESNTTATGGGDQGTADKKEPDADRKEPDADRKEPDADRKEPDANKKGEDTPPTEEKKGENTPPTEEKKGENTPPTEENKGENTPPTEENKGENTPPTEEKKGEDTPPTEENKGEDTPPTEEKKGEDTPPTEEKKGGDNTPAEEKETKSDKEQENKGEANVATNDTATNDTATNTPQPSTPSKPSGGKTPSYMKSTASRDIAIAETNKQFKGAQGKAALPSGMQKSSATRSQSPSPTKNSSVKSAAPTKSSAPVKQRSSAPVKQRPTSSGGSSVKSATQTKSPGYAAPTASSTAKQRPPVQRSSGPQKKK